MEVIVHNGGTLPLMELSWEAYLMPSNRVEPRNERLCVLCTEAFFYIYVIK
jgi:hypothetical protein